MVTHFYLRAILTEMEILERKRIFFKQSFEIEGLTYFSSRSYVQEHFFAAKIHFEADAGGYSSKQSIRALPSYEEFHEVNTTTLNVAADLKLLWTPLRDLIRNELQVLKAFLADPFEHVIEHIRILDRSDFKKVHLILLNLVQEPPRLD